MLSALIMLCTIGHASPGEVLDSNADYLVAAIVKFNRGGAKTIILKDATYTLQNMLWVETHGVTVRSGLAVWWGRVRYLSGWIRMQHLWCGLRGEVTAFA